MKKIILIVALCLCSVVSLPAEESNLKIGGIKEIQSKYSIQVGSSWLKCPKKIEVALRVDEDIPAGKVFVRAYFYDANKKLVQSYAAPCPIWITTTKGTEALGLPTTLRKGADIEVFFPVTDEVEELKWKTVLVVFGSGQTATARSKPQDEASSLEFPEKAFSQLDQ